MFTHISLCSQLTWKFFQDNRIKLAAEIEFLPQEIWNKMRDRLR